MKETREERKAREERERVKRALHPVCGVEDK